MIELNEVVKKFNDRIAVDHINLKVKKGEICVLLGESGCGKSTTLNMINKLIVADEGEIYINGTNIREINSENLRRNIGYAVQSTGLFPHMTVADNIAVVPKLLGWGKNKISERIFELIKLIGLEPDIYASKYPRQLSGGEAQRIGVARALAANPEILLMDEPFGAVDPINRSNLQNEFLNIQKNLEKTIIFVTHDISEALKLGDNIIIMSKGKIIAQGTSLELIKNKDPKILNFLGSQSLMYFLSKYNIKDVIKQQTETENIKSRLNFNSNMNAYELLTEMLILGEKSLFVKGSHGQEGIVEIDDIFSLMSNIKED